jgi:hypothetical protein
MTDIDPKTLTRYRLATALIQYARLLLPPGEGVTIIVHALASEPPQPVGVQTTVATRAAMRDVLQLAHTESLSVDAVGAEDLIDRP